jgi:hypothetical protein
MRNLSFCAWIISLNLVGSWWQHEKSTLMNLSRKRNLLGRTWKVHEMDLNVGEPGQEAREANAAEVQTPPTVAASL